MASHLSAHCRHARPSRSLPAAKGFHLLSFHSVAETQSQTRTKTFSHIYQECSVGKYLRPGKQAHARMIVSGFIPTVFVTNCLIELYKKCSRLDCARKVFDGMPERDTVTWNAMVSGYASTGNMGFAESLFDLMPEKDVISWNSLMSGYEQNCNYYKSIDVFAKMRKRGLEIDHSTFSILSRVCSVLEELQLGIQVHALAIKTGILNVVASTALLDMYAKCKELDSSFRMFQEMPESNLVSWSALIAGCVHNGHPIQGIEVFIHMQRGGIGVSQSTYASVFRSCAGLAALRPGAQLHSHAVKNGFKSDPTVMTACLDMYAKCVQLSEARKIFNSMPKHNLESYNAIIIGSVQNNNGSEVMNLFRILQRSALGFNEISLSGALSACGIIKGDLEGRQLHGLAVKSDLDSNICVSNAVLDMYGKCGDLGDACSVFDEMERRDAVSWNAIITAHEQNEDETRTITLFSSMIGSGMEPDEFTYGSVLKACASNQDLQSGIQIHSRIVKSGMNTNSFVGIALIDTYCKCGKIDEAEKIHMGLEKQTIISWNAIISGFALHDQSEEAQQHFSSMLETGMSPDTFTYATVLDTCANLATESLGKQLHAQILKQRLHTDVYICSTLVDMYSKCGNLPDSVLMFEKAPNRDFVTWNAMIGGYAQHGHGHEALRIFEQMETHNLKPNHSTFISVLRACAHIGIYETGSDYFELMQKKYGLSPQVEHYCCMVDILGRSGRIEEALKMVIEMPIEADSVIWRNLLNTCSTHGNIEVAEKAAAAILQMEPGDSSTYVLLSNIYANAKLWEEVSKLRKTMKYNKLRKEPGFSWIEVGDEVHMFLVGDVAHPRCGEMYKMLHLLIGETKGVLNPRSAELAEFDWIEEDELQETCVGLLRMT